MLYCGHRYHIPHPKIQVGCAPVPRVHQREEVRRRDHRHHSQAAAEVRGDLQTRDPEAGGNLLAEGQLEDRVRYLQPPQR